jgi:ATP-dependent DNA helicase RecG
MVELSHRPDIRVFAFASEDKEYQPLLDDILDGPMVGRFDTEEAGKALIDGGLIERLMSTIMPFITSEALYPIRIYVGKQPGIIHWKLFAKLL